MNMTQLYYCEHIYARNTKKIVLKSRRIKNIRKEPMNYVHKKYKKEN